MNSTKNGIIYGLIRSGKFDLKHNNSLFLKFKRTFIVEDHFKEVYYDEQTVAQIQALLQRDDLHPRYREGLLKLLSHNVITK